jgi:hypothetical protein
LEIFSLCRASRTAKALSENSIVFFRVGCSVLNGTFITTAEGCQGVFGLLKR